MTKIIVRLPNNAMLGIEPDNERLHIATLEPTGVTEWYAAEIGKGSVTVMANSGDATWDLVNNLTKLPDQWFTLELRYEQAQPPGSTEEGAWRRWFRTAYGNTLLRCGADMMAVLDMSDIPDAAKVVAIELFNEFVSGEAFGNATSFEDDEFGVMTLSLTRPAN